MKSVFTKDEPEGLQEIRAELMKGNPVRVNNEYETFYGNGFDRWLREGVKDIPCRVLVTGMHPWENYPESYIIYPRKFIDNRLEIFLNIKEKNFGKIVLMENNREFESFQEDARLVSHELGLKLYENGDHKRVSFDKDKINDYLKTLVGKGHKVCLASV